MTTKRRGRPLAAAAGGWAAFGLIGQAFWFVGYGLASIIIGVICGLIAGILAAIDVHQNGARLNRPQVVATTKRERKPPHVLPKNYVYRTRRQRAAQRRANIEKGHVHTGTTRMAGRTCSHRCRKSRLPRFTCRCVCGSQNHGVESGILAMPRIVTEILAEVAPAPAPRRATAPRGKKGAAPRRRARAMKPRGPSKPVIPPGDLDLPVLLTWRNPEDKVVRVQTTKATAQIINARGRLIKCEAVYVKPWAGS